MNSRRTVRVAVVGLGAFGQLHLRTYLGLPFVQVVAVCDADLTTAHTTGQRYGIAHSFNTLDELLAADLEVDALSLATPEALHAEQCLAAFAKGKHVLVEKPLATSSEDADRVASHSEDLILMVGHILRFDTRYVAVKRSIDADELGRVKVVTSRRNVHKGLAKTYSRVHLAFLNMIHDIDLAVWYLDRKVRSVQASQLHLQSSTNGHPDFVSATLTMDDGSLAVLETGYVWPDRSANRIDVSTAVMGTKGIAVVNSPSNALQISLDDSERSEDPGLWPDANGSPGGAIENEIEYFVNCVRSQRPVGRSKASDAAYAVRVAEAVVEAASSGARIEL